MVDDLSPFFESRDTRVNRLPEEVRERFQVAEKQAIESGRNDFTDKQFVSLWLSRRTGLPRKDVIANFNSISQRYFGEGATPSTAYDRISESYKSTRAGGENVRSGERPSSGADAGAVPTGREGEQQGGEWTPTEGLPKVGAEALLYNVDQSARSAVSGFEAVAQRFPAGLYSQASAITGVPQPKDPMSNAEYASLKRQNERILDPYKFTQIYDEPMGFGPVPSLEEEELIKQNEARMREIRQLLDSEHRDAVKQWESSARGEVSKEFRRLSDFWYDLSDKTAERWGVDPDFQQTALGQFMNTAGGVPATAAMAVMGPGGLVALESVMFADVEQERREIEGEDYDPEAALGENLLATLPQVALERALGVERLLNRALRETPKFAGKVTFGDYARNFVKRGFASGVEEGVTEPSQGFWNDYVASLTYDEQRALLTGDAAKQRLIESVTGFALGFIYGGGVSLAQTYDRSSAAGEARDYLTTKEGTPLTSADFKLLRELKTDAEISSMSSDPETGRILLSAVNGDVNAQEAYNNRMLEAKFVQTEKLDIDGMTIGLANGVPVARSEDGRIVPLDMTNPEERSFFENFKETAVLTAQAKAREETLAQMERAHGELLEAERVDLLPSVQDLINDGTLTEEQAADAVEVAKVHNGLPDWVTAEIARPEGQATTQQVGDQIKMMVKVAASANPDVAIEEVSEAWAQRAIKQGNLNPAELSDARKAWFEQSGEQDIAADFEGEKLARANIEWFSKRVTEYALANRKTALPASWGKWLRTLGDQIKKFLRGAARMKKLLRDGKLDPKLEDWMQRALGQKAEPEREPAEVTARRERQAELEQAFAARKPDAATRESPGAYEQLKEQLRLEDIGAKKLAQRIESARAESEPAYEITSQLSAQAQRILEEEGYGSDITFSLAPATNTKAFKDWFGDSKVVDENGNPMVVYHGTEAISEEGFVFDYSKIGQHGRFEGAGFYFTDDKTVASGYATGFLIEAYLSIQNPMKYDQEGLSAEGLAPLIERISELELESDPELEGDIMNGWVSNYGSVEDAAELISNDETLIDQLGGIQGSGVEPEIINRAVRGVLGYDGVRSDGFSGEGKAGGVIWVAFFPEQVKSVNNRGTFDPTNPDITFELTGIPQNQKQALDAQLERIRSKKLAATDELIRRIQNNEPVPERVKMLKRTTDASLLARVAVPVTGRLQRIAPKLAVRLRRFEYDLGQATMRDFQRLQPFMDGISRMDRNDSLIIDLSLKNGDTERRDAILAKYGLEEAYREVESVLSETRQRAIAAGYKVGEIADYFPRKVMDVDGLMTFYYGRPEFGVVEKAIERAEKKAAEKGMVLLPEERIEVVNRALQGYAGLGQKKPGNLKERTTEVVSPDANQFYADSLTALIGYIDSINRTVEQRRFFGKHAVTIESTSDGTFKSNQLAIDASIGAMVSEMVANGELDRTRQNEVKSMLEGRFNQGVANQFIKDAKALAYMATMGQYTSALTQIGDLAFSLYENGVFDTMAAAGEAVTRKSKVTREGLGIDNVAEEFREPSRMHAALNSVFKWTGLHYMDMVGKETLVNAKIRKMQREAKAGRLSKRSINQINTVFGDDAARVVSELASGEVTSDVKFAAYNVLADYQPISLSEYPESYLRHPNGRIFYMLKTFTLKQIEAFRREGIDLIVKGDAKQKAQGMTQLMRLAGLFYLVNLPVDWIKDWLMGRDPQMDDLAIDNLWKLMGISRWHIWNFRYRANPVESASLLVLPPAPFIQYPLMDAKDVAAKIAEGDEVKPGEFESWRMLPFVGAPYYWHAGGGAEKVRKRKEKREK